MFQESLKAAFIQAGGKFLEHRLVQHELEGLKVGIVQNGKQSVGSFQVRAQCGERFGKLREADAAVAPVMTATLPSSYFDMGLLCCP
jgi:hypothetical protein